MEDDNGGDEYDYEYDDEEDIDDDEMEPGAGESGEGAAGAAGTRSSGAGRSSSMSGGEDLAMRDETVAFVDQAQLKMLMSKVVADIRCARVRGYLLSLFIVEVAGAIEKIMILYW